MGAGQRSWRRAALSLPDTHRTNGRGACRSAPAITRKRRDGTETTRPRSASDRGCPATAVINLDIENHLRDRGISDIRLERQLSPAWTTDWITEAGRDKLRAYGIAPPIDGTAADGQVVARIGALTGSNLVVACPRCGSNDTRRVSQFGSTPCKASWVCNACLEPFDYFKCH